MIQKKGRPVLRIFLVFFTGILLWGSCRTLPHWEFTQFPLLLPSDGQLYLYLPVSTHRSLIDKVLPSNPPQGMLYFLNRTRELYGVLLSEKDGKDASWIFLALGEYSSFLVRSALSEDQGWKREEFSHQGYRIPYFQHQNLGVQIALLEGNLLLVSNGAIPTVLKRYVSPSITLAPPPLSAWIERSDLIELFLSSQGLKEIVSSIPLFQSPVGDIPGIRLLRLVLEPKDGKELYVARGVLSFDQEAQARSMGIILRLLVGTWILGQEIKQGQFTPKIIAEGTYIQISDLPIPSQTLVEVLKPMVDRWIERNSLW
ncbi:MAG: hypothetical protein SNJ78_01030 [Spirochaetales bacterium]